MQKPHKKASPPKANSAPRRTTSPNILKILLLISTFLRHRWNVFSGRLRPEQYRDPLCAFIVLACKLQGHGKRYAQNHADRTKQASPKNQREKDNQRGQSKHTPHEPCFNHIVKYEVNGHISCCCHHGAAYP